MTVLNLTIDTGDTNTFIKSGDATGTALSLAQLFKGLAGGARQANTSLIAQTTPLPASGTITLSSSSGVLTATINAVACATASLSGTDAENATALAAAITASANALVSGVVTAAAVGAVVTVTSVVKGKVANAITLAASGTGATASGARLTAGSNGTQVTQSF